MNCKLCETKISDTFFHNGKREFYHCSKCDLIFVPQKYQLPVLDEKKRYDLHDNTSLNTGYVKYLSEVVKIVKGVYKPGNSILDFGAGKNAVLTELFLQDGCDCTSYDPLYTSDNCIDEKEYDIIILCEVIEHIRELKLELDRVYSLLKSNGFLILRTQFYSEIIKFSDWWYIQDLTHINFLSFQTIDFIARKYSFNVKFTDKKDIILLQKAIRNI